MGALADLNTLLHAVFERERERRANKLPPTYFASEELAAQLGWEPERFNLAVELLAQRRWVELDDTTGSAPFATQGLFLTPAGWVECEQKFGQADVFTLTEGSLSSVRMVSKLRGLLFEIKENLRAAEPYPWSNIEVLVTRARPLVLKEFPDQVEGFAEVCKTPSWLELPLFSSGGSPWGDDPPSDNFAEAAAEEERTNRQRAAEVRDRIVAFIESLLAIPEVDAARSVEGRSPVARLQQVLERFPAVVRALTKRTQKRRVLAMNDEYDVQYLLGALLAVDFDDVRPEEWTPSYAGNSSRMDFLLKRERIVVEAKFARPGHADKEIANELIIDKERYKSHTDCAVLVCFVFDPKQSIKNPIALEDDLAQDARPRCHVIVRPK